MREGTVIDKARNELVAMALKDNCDFILFVDSDIIMPKEGIDCLINMDVDISSGLYFSKGKPYMPVARVKDGDRHFFLEDFEYNEIFEISGVGMGMCLIKTDVFRNMEYPYFKLEWREKDGIKYQIAEDLYFCEEALKKGYKTYLNTGVVCQHWGTEAGPEQFMIYKDRLKENHDDREEMIEDLIEFEKVDREEINHRFLKMRELELKEMEGVDFTNPKQNEEYYKNNQYGIYRQLEWHFKERRNYDRKIIEEIKKMYPDRNVEILDFGCGSGQLDYMLAKEKFTVSCCDLNKKANDFISFRFTKRRQKIKRINMPISENFKNKYDVIFCFDVLEHIPDEKFEETINLLKKLKKENGIIVSTTSFGVQNYHPNHMDMTERKKELILELAK
jgi:hypothetical protein